MNFERVDLGNIRGKNGAKGTDGTGIDYVEDLGYTLSSSDLEILQTQDNYTSSVTEDGFNRFYKIHWSDPYKKRYIYWVRDGENLSLVNEITNTGANKDKGVKSSAIYNALIGKSSYNHLHGDINSNGEMPTNQNLVNNQYASSSNPVPFDKNDMPIVRDDDHDKRLQYGKVATDHIIDTNETLDEIGNSSQDTQTTINSKINTALNGKIPKSINLNASSTNFIDLDDITNTGFYYLIGNTNCKYIKHKPLDTVNNQSTLADYNAVTTNQNPMNAMSFFLMVEQNSNGSYVKQTWTMYHRDDPRTFIRTRLQDSTGWGEWFEVQMNNIYEFVPSTQSTSTNEWTGKLLHTNTIKNGTVIYYNLRKAPTTGNVSLNLTLPNGSTTGAKNVLLLDNTRLTNQFPTNSTIAMVYNGSTWRVINPVIPSSTNTDIKMNGLNASAGTSTLYARADHVHPSDTSRSPVGHTHTKSEITDFVENSTFPTENIINSSALSTIGTSADATQKQINEAINSYIGDIDTTLAQQGAITVQSELTESSDNPVKSSGIYAVTKNKIDKGIIDGGTNICKGTPISNANGGNVYVVDSSTFHERPVYHIDNISKTSSQYSDIGFDISSDNFTNDDVFTFSFYIKGTNGKNFKTYFYGSNSIPSKRLVSNSTVTTNMNIGDSYGDGATEFALTSNWKKYYVTYHLQSTGGTANVTKRIIIRVYGTSEAYVSNIQLERGYNATDYRPNVIAELDNRALTNHTHPYTDLEDPINLDSSNPIDYNDYTTVGHYKVWSTTQAHADTLNKPPSDTQGGLLVVEEIPNGYLQILYNYYNASPKIYYRIYHTTQGWRDWQTLSVDGHTHPSTDLKSVPLSATQEAPVDLNNIIKTGFYYNNANTQCQYITPLPIKNTAFWLLVEDWASSSYTKQTLTHYNDGGFTYVRIRNGGNWQPWKKIKDENDTPQRYSSEIIHNSTVINDYTWIDESYYFNGWSEWDVYGDMKFSDTKKRFEIHKYGDTGLKNFIGIGVSGDTGALTCWWGTSSSAESTYAFKDDDNNYIIPSVNTWYSFRLSRRGKYIIFEFDNKYIHSIEASYFTGFERISPRLFSYKANGTVSCRGLTIQPKQSSMDNLIMCRDIPSNADLNNYIHQSNGYYRCNTSAIAQSLTNCPTQWAFNMVVYQMGETTSGTAPVRQEIRPYRVNSDDQVIYARNYFSGTWEDWQMYAPVTNNVSDIKMDGTASVGSKYTSARSDHVHPTDTSRASKDVASSSANGLMSSTDWQKLNNIEVNANNYTHPSYTARTGKPTTNLTPDFGDTITISQITSNNTGHVTGANDKTITLPSTNATSNTYGLVQLESVPTLNSTKAITSGGVYTSLAGKLNKTGTDTGFVKSNGTIVGFGTTATTVSKGNHTHGSLANTGTLNSDISSVNKIAVTDSSHALKTISKLPFDKVNITKENITNLGISSSDHTHQLDDISNYVSYTIESDNYNPHIGDTILLTFTAKDGGGNGLVSSDHLTIKSTKYNGVDKYANYDIEIQTDNNGTTTMNLPIIAWGIIDFEWNGIHCQVNSTGWLDVATVNNTIPSIGDNTSKWYLMRNETSARLVLNGWVNSTSSTVSYNPSTNAVSGTDTWQPFGGTTDSYKYAKRIRPKINTVGVNSFATAYFRIQNDGFIKYRSTIGTLPAQSKHYCVIEWTINEEDLYNYNVLFSNGQPYLEY